MDAIKILSQDIIDGEILDTHIKLDFEFTVIGQELEKFGDELEQLINKYRI